MCRSVMPHMGQSAFGISFLGSVMKSAGKTRQRIFVRCTAMHLFTPSSAEHLWLRWIWTHSRNVSMHYTLWSLLWGGLHPHKQCVCSFSSKKDSHSADSNDEVSVWTQLVHIPLCALRRRACQTAIFPPVGQQGPSPFFIRHKGGHWLRHA